jgi:hypothetical protein
MFSILKKHVIKKVFNLKLFVCQKADISYCFKSKNYLANKNSNVVQQMFRNYSDKLSVNVHKGMVSFRENF